MSRGHNRAEYPRPGDAHANGLCSGSMNHPPRRRSPTYSQPTISTAAIEIARKGRRRSAIHLGAHRSPAAGSGRPPPRARPRVPGKNERAGDRIHRTHGLPVGLVGLGLSAVGEAPGVGEQVGGSGASRVDSAACGLGDRWVEAADEPHGDLPVDLPAVRVAAGATAVNATPVKVVAHDRLPVGAPPARSWGEWCGTPSRRGSAARDHIATTVRRRPGQVRRTCRSVKGVHVSHSCPASLIPRGCASGRMLM
jgi:hypothetical protein